MKLPWWLVSSLLSTSMLAVLAAAVWCWITWPEKTACEFQSLIAHGKLEYAERMMAADSAADPDRHNPPDEWLLSNGRREFQLVPPTTGDMFAGRRHFRSQLWIAEFTAQAGKISVRCNCEEITRVLQPYIGHPDALKE